MKDARFSHRTIREAINDCLLCAKQGGLDTLTFEDVATLLGLRLSAILEERKAQLASKGAKS